VTDRITANKLSLKRLLSCTSRQAKSPRRKPLQLFTLTLRRRKSRRTTERSRLQPLRRSTTPGSSTSSRCLSSNRKIRPIQGSRRGSNRLSSGINATAKRVASELKSKATATATTRFEVMTKRLRVTLRRSTISSKNKSNETSSSRQLSIPTACTTRSETRTA